MVDRLVGITLETQRDIFRLASRDHEGLSRKEISSKSGIGYDALGTYARGEHVMPFTEVLKLFDVIPNYLLSRLLDPVGQHFAPNESEDGDLDAVAREAAGFTNEYVAAKSTGNVTPIEKTKLRNLAVVLAAAAESAAA